MGIKTHVEIDRLNPVVTTVFEKPITMDFQTQTINVVSFDLQPNGDLKFTDVPLAPVTSKRSNR